MARDPSESEVPKAASQDLGKWIRTMRLSIDLNQRDLAAKAGISQSYLCDIEVGRGGTPSLAVLDRLSTALGASKAELLQVAGILESIHRSAPDETENRMLMLFRNLSPEGKETIERFARFVLTEEHRWIQRSLLEPEDSDRSQHEAQGPTLFE